MTIYIDPRCPPEVERMVRERARQQGEQVRGRGIRAALEGGRLLMVTLGQDGAAYGLDTGKAVPSKVANTLQCDLFVTPSDDGLFPGHSQTWKVSG